MKGSCVDFIYWLMFSLYFSYAKFFLTRAVGHQNFKHKKFCLNKYMYIENQMQKEEKSR